MGIFNFVMGSTRQTETMGVVCGSYPHISEHYVPLKETFRASMDSRIVLLHVDLIRIAGICDFILSDDESVRVRAKSILVLENCVFRLWCNLRISVPAEEVNLFNYDNFPICRVEITGGEHDEHEEVLRVCKACGVDHVLINRNFQKVVY